MGNSSSTGSALKGSLVENDSVVSMEPEQKATEVKMTMNIGGCRVSLCVGDLYEEDTMAILQKINKNFSNSSDSAQRLLRKIGPKVLKEIEEYGSRNLDQISPGRIFITSGGNLKATSVIFVVQSRSKDTEAGEELKLLQEVTALLGFAERNRLLSISCPAASFTLERQSFNESLAICFQGIYGYFYQNRDSCLKCIRIITRNESVGDLMVQEGWKFHLRAKNGELFAPEATQETEISSQNKQSISL